MCIYIYMIAFRYKVLEHNVELPWFFEKLHFNKVKFTKIISASYNNGDGNQRDHKYIVPSTDLELLADLSDERHLKYYVDDIQINNRLQSRIFENYN